MGQLREKGKIKNCFAKRRYMEEPVEFGRNIYKADLVILVVPVSSASCKK